jgi:hypothetical protein
MAATLYCLNPLPFAKACSSFSFMPRQVNGHLLMTILIALLQAVST